MSVGGQGRRGRLAVASTLESRLITELAARATDVGARCTRHFRDMGRAKKNPFERTSVQLMLVAAVVALFANSAVDRTDEGLPWEATLTGFCLFGVIFSAIYADKTELALGIVGIIGVIFIIVAAVVVIILADLNKGIPY